MSLYQCNWAWKQTYTHTNESACTCITHSHIQMAHNKFGMYWLAGWHNIQNMSYELSECAIEKKSNANYTLQKNVHGKFKKRWKRERERTRKKRRKQIKNEWKKKWKRKRRIKKIAIKKNTVACSVPANILR